MAKNKTSDTEVLDWVQNCHIEFIDDIEPVQLGGHKVARSSLID